MSESTPHFAPIVVLLFLGTILISGISLIALLYGAARGSKRFAAFGGLSFAIILAGYFTVLLGFSLFSRETVLPAGGWKYFCEIDCHMAYSIAGVQAVTPGEAKSTAPGNRRLIVEVKSWFDPGTISPHRGDGPLTPNSRRVILIDDQTRSYFPSPDRTKAQSRDTLSCLQKPLRPGESCISEFVFDIPQQVAGLRLLISEDDPETSFVIGHENSFLHKKIYLGLDVPGTATISQQSFPDLWSYPVGHP